MPPTSPHNSRLRNTLIPLFLFVGLASLWLGIGGFPVVLHHSDNTVFPAAQANETVVNPLKGIDMN